MKTEKILKEENSQTIGLRVWWGDDEADDQIQFLHHQRCILNISKVWWGPYMPLFIVEKSE